MQEARSVQELTGSESGRWRVVTATGSVYSFDFDHRTVSRQAGAGSAATINDFERPLEGIVECRVGALGLWTIRSDSALVDFYWSRTTPILRIEEVTSEAPDGSDAEDEGIAR